MATHNKYRLTTPPNTGAETGTGAQKGERSFLVRRRAGLQTEGTETHMHRYACAHAVEKGWVDWGGRVVGVGL